MSVADAREGGSPVKRSTDTAGGGSAAHVECVVDCAPTFRFCRELPRRFGELCDPAIVLFLANWWPLLETALIGRNVEVVLLLSSARLGVGWRLIELLEIQWRPAVVVTCDPL
eukprot:scaffold78237_cov30-Tisochrysis_lutea.AAC.2